MSLYWGIVGACEWLSRFFYEVYQDCHYAIYIPEDVAYGFYKISEMFADWSWHFYNWGVWLESQLALIASFLSWETIRDYIISWFYWLDDLSTLFQYFWYNVITILLNWWADISLLVQGWIDEAKALLQDQLNYLTWLWGNLQAAWDAFKGKIPSIDEIIAWFANWWGNVLATVINWGALTATQIGSLIDSVIRNYAPFWEGWLDWRDSVIEFIQDPWQWLYDRAEELFDRFW